MTVAQLAAIPESAEVGAVLTAREVASITGVSIETLRFLQLGDNGPAYTESADGRIRYRLADIHRWQAIRRAAHARLMASYRQFSR